MVNPSPVVEVGVIETIKNFLRPESIAYKLDVNKNTLMDIGLYGAIGFIAGLLLKRYSEYLISLAILVVGLIVLQQFDYIEMSINSAKLQSALGLQQTAMTEVSYGSLLLGWMRIHVIGSSSLAIGFLIGLKVG